MDADVGVEVLGLSYMKGHVAHAGFPEVGYGPAADKLVRAGYKVARVEQTETPEQLKERKAKMTKGQKKPAVVNREVCSILSLGTRTFCALDDKDILAEVDSVENNKTGGPLLAIAENMLDPVTTIPNNSPDEDDDSQVQAVCEYGITLVDAVRATVTVGQFADDVLRSRLNTLLARLAPSEILVSESASPTLVGLVKTFQRSNQCRYEVVRDQETFPKSTALEASHRQQLERKTLTVHPWSVPETLAELHRRAYYPRASKTSDSIQRWPAVLQALVQGEAKLALSSFGASLFFLQRHLIDQEILSMGIVKAYIPESSSNIPSPTPLSLPDSREEDDMEVDSATPAAGLSSIPVTSSAEDHITHLSLDGTTLHNLEILTNAVDQKVAGSLWSKINYCKSPHGARFLRAWLLRPLFKKSEIDRRADAVQELASGAGAVALHEARQTVLGKVGDLDRLLSRIHSMSGSVTNAREDDATAGYHPNERAVLYENATYTKRKVNDFSKALTGLRRACQIPEIFADLQQLDPKGLLFKIVKSRSAGGCFPEMAEELDWFFDNFDCEQAAQGHFEPSRGVDEAYDHACDTIDRVHAELEDYKKEMCRELSPRQGATIGWKYINTAPESKDKYLIELPATIRVPDDFLVKGKRGAGHKQVNKYRTSVVAGLVQELERALEIQSARKAKGMQLIFAKFDSMRSVWSAAAHAAAMLDALGSLAKVATKPSYCRPTILDCPSDQPPLVDIIQGRHPCVEGSSIHSAEFIPNDLKLGGKPDDENDAARLLLLSGPNMGGKSTLLRQTCLISILAQMGSYVPAESCSLTPVDCIYTRLGASDRILLGQSTFFVELAETAAALRGATRRSLVIMGKSRSFLFLLGMLLDGRIPIPIALLVPVYRRTGSWDVHV
jgi:DNA mismatch repair protein MSH6